jgi:hypothetical protein
MKSIIRIIAIIIISFFTTLVYSQNKSEVSIITIGSAKNLNDAKQEALRSAAKQVFSTFISSETELFKEQLVADQIPLISNGIIKSFLVLNESQLPNGRWAVTVRAIISLDKLASIVNAKGIALEINEGMSYFNIKQQLLKEQCEINAINEMVGLLHEAMQISFDYVIKSGEPKSLDADNKKRAIPLEVKVISNKNLNFCENYCIKTLTALSLSTEEVNRYESLNKKVFPVDIVYNNIPKTFYLRKENSINAINTLNYNWDFYTRLFTVQSGLDEINGNSLKFYTADRSVSFGCALKFGPWGDGLNRSDRTYISPGRIMETFSWQDYRTLSQIKQISSYKVKPIGVSSHFKHGGFVIYEKDGHGLVAAPSDLDFFPNDMNWSSAKTACDELVLNGYSDWYLPTKEELNAIYLNLAKFRNGNFKSDYWSSSESDSINAWVQNFYNGNQKKWDKGYTSHIRAVRAF